MVSATRRWLLVSVVAPPRGEEHLLVDALRRLGAHAVDREGERFVAWLPPPADAEAVVAEAERVVRASTSLADPGLRWRWEEPGEWAARWGGDLAPRRVTDRIVIAPANSAVDLPLGVERSGVERSDRERPGDLVIRLHPSTAFGTAEHPTTRLCLRFLDRLARQGDRVADIGTGSGVLAIAAALLGAASVLAVEVDPVACDAARANVRANARAAGLDNEADLSDLADRVRVRELKVGADEVRRLGRFDGVVVNLEWPLLQPILPALPETLVDGGWLILAGPLEPERDSVLADARGAGLTLQEEMAESGWWAGWLRKAKAAGRSVDHRIRPV
jgi:ribosomal protein L11 methyltransferase